MFILESNCVSCLYMCVWVCVLEVCANVSAVVSHVRYSVGSTDSTYEDTA